MHNKLLLSTMIGFIVVSILGTLGHFVYDWTGQNVFVGFLFPINESTWEHMKLAFFPMLFWFFLEGKWHKKQEPFSSCVNLASALIATFFIPVLFYTYSGILGQNYSPLDIATYYVSILLAFILRYFMLKKNWHPKNCWLIGLLVILMSIGFFIFTYYPPSLGIFQNPE